MARVISTNGRKKLKTLQDEFNDKFPHLKIAFSLKPSHGVVIQKSDRLDNNKKLSEVRTKTGSGKISINGRKKVETLEKEFQDIFGLFVQVSFWYRSSDGTEGWIQTYDSDGYNLTKLNKNSLLTTRNPPKKDW